jgi:hypothetical protein
MMSLTQGLDFKRRLMICPKLLGDAVWLKTASKRRTFMTVRLHVTFVACLASLLGGATRLSAQFDTFIAHMADGGGFFSEISVYNPGTSGVSCTFSTFDDGGGPLDLVYAATSIGSAPSFRAHSALSYRAHTKATSSSQSSVPFTVPAGGTATFQTTGEGDGSSTALAGGAELNCSNLVIGGVTYWLTDGSELVTGIGVPATNTTTAFRVDGGNADTGFAFYNPSQVNELHLTVEAYDGDTGALIDSVDLTIPPNGHFAFNAQTQMPNLPSDFYGSFRVPSNGQQFVPLALGVANTKANSAGFLIYSLPTLSGVIVGID